MIRYRQRILQPSGQTSTRSSAEPSQCFLQDRLKPTEVQRRVSWRKLHGGGANLQEQIIHYIGFAEVFLVELLRNKKH